MSIFVHNVSYYEAYYRFGKKAYKKVMIVIMLAVENDLLVKIDICRFW